jgi:fructokinase
VRPLVLGIGELLWDLFPDGRRLGGAPANFAGHAARLGCRGAVASRVGDDALGREALARLDALGVDRRQVQVDPQLPTSTVTVTVDAEGHPAYLIHEPVAWDALDCSEALLILAATADALCFGTLASRAPRALATLLQALEVAGPGCLRIFDVNLRQAYFTPERVRTLLNRCDVLKLNEDELPVVAAMADVTGDLAEGLRKQFGLRLVALTLGPRGSVLYTPQGRLEEPGSPVAVVDTVGAGDAFTAALAAGVLQGLDLPIAHRRAAKLSAFVCTQEGATPDTSELLRTEPCFQ